MAANKPEEILGLVELACVSIQVFSLSSPDGQQLGSGTILKKSGANFLLLTCGHVLLPALNSDCTIKVIFADGSESPHFKPISTLVEADKEVGLLFGYDPQLETTDLKTICKFSDVEAFEKLYCGSYPYGVQQPHVVQGRVSQKTIYSKISKCAIAYNLSVGQGSSGAAIVNGRGEIIAVHIAGHESPVVDDSDDKMLIGFTEGIIKFGIPSSHIKDVLSGFCRSIGTEDHATIAGLLVGVFNHFREKDEEARKEEEERAKARKRRREEKRRKEREEKTFSVIDKVQEKSRTDRKPPGVWRGRGRGREDGPGRQTKGIGRGMDDGGKGAGGRGRGGPSGKPGGKAAGGRGR